MRYEQLMEYFELMGDLWPGVYLVSYGESIVKEGTASELIREFVDSSTTESEVMGLAVAITVVMRCIETMDDQMALGMSDWLVRLIVDFVSIVGANSSPAQAIWDCMFCLPPVVRLTLEGIRRDLG